jgi:hypothetical protein
MSKNWHKDPLDETQANPELPRLLDARVMRGLAHLTFDSSAVTEAAARRGAAKAAMVYGVVVLTVVVLVAARMLVQPHGGS